MLCTFLHSISDGQTRLSDSDSEEFLLSRLKLAKFLTLGLALRLRLEETSASKIRKIVDKFINLILKIHFSLKYVKTDNQMNNHNVFEEFKP